jgi:hypothetical protein
METVKYYPTQPRVPFENLERYLRGADELMRENINDPDAHLVSAAGIALRCGVDRQTVHRWRKEGGIPIFAADRVAIRLGVHPLDIWPTFHSEEYLCHT